MKKITLFFAAIFVVTLVFSQTTYKWFGGQTNQVWDYSTANWLNQSLSYPLNMIPTTFTESSSALFDESSAEGSDTIKITGSIDANTVTFDASRYYFLNYTVATDSLKGTGYLEKKGTGTLEMNIKNKMAKGTVIYNGRLVMQKSSSPNVIGDTLICEGGTVNLGTSGSTSSSKVTSKFTVVIPENKTANLELARYSYLAGKIVGSGALNLLCAGERTFIGYGDSSLPSGVTEAMPDWSKFTGDIKISKLVTSTTPGFWGLLLYTNKTYKDSLEFGFNVDSTLYNKKVTIGSGAVLSSHSGTRAYAIGELNAEDNTAMLVGYRSNSTGPRIFYFVGGLNTDVVFPGRICQAPGITTHYTHVGFVKVGTGTYTLTNPNNDIIGGVQVRQGRVLINSTIPAGQYYGGVGAFASVSSKGTLGGVGRMGGNVDVYGELQPGVDGVGTLLLSDSISAVPKSKYGIPFSYSFTYTNASNASTTYTYKNGGTGTASLNLMSGSKSTFEIANSNSYDKIVATGKLKFGADTGNGKPKIKISLAPSYDVKDGDRFEIIKVRSLDVASADYDVEYPNVGGLTWSIEAKYDTVQIDKESFSFANKVTTKWTTDSIVNTIVTLDSILVNYKVTVIAHGNASEINNIINTGLKMFPNPANGVVNFSVDNAEIKAVEIVNLQGQTIRVQNFKSSMVNMNISDLSAGIYYAKVHLDGDTKVQKLIIK